MSSDTDLQHRLDLALDDLPSVPAGAYLAVARRTRRRRRARNAVGGVLAAVVVAGVAVGLTPSGREPVPDTDREVAAATADPRDLPAATEYRAPEPANHVRAQNGLGDAEAFSTAGIPDWAQEYGNHGPVAVAPDGRLWVAPEAQVRRTIVDPLGKEPDDGSTVAVSYAVEALRDTGAAQPEVVWVLLVADENGATVGTMDDPGRWTDDFELWVDDETSQYQGRPSFAERLVRFAGSRSDRIVPASEGVQVRRQQEVTLSGDWEQHPRSSAAEVRWDGRTWFVLAQGPRHGDPFFDAVDPEVVDVDFAGYLATLRGDRS